MLRDAIYLRANDQTIPQFEAEGVGPFQYVARGKTITLRSYWKLPERLYDDPDELADWARGAFEAARNAAALKNAKKSAGPKTRAKKAARVKATRSGSKSKRQAT